MSGANWYVSALIGYDTSAIGAHHISASLPGPDQDSAPPDASMAYSAFTQFFNPGLDFSFLMSL